MAALTYLISAYGVPTVFVAAVFLFLWHVVRNSEFQLHYPRSSKDVSGKERMRRVPREARAVATKDERVSTSAKTKKARA